MQAAPIPIECISTTLPHPQVLSGKARPATSALSDRIGLQHSFLAAEAQGMLVSLTQQGGKVVFEAELDVEVVASQAEAKNTQLEEDLTRFPQGLAIYCIDDSASARRLLHHNLITWANTTNVHMFGRDELEVSRFTSAALANADIAILDQHLEYGGETNILGTDLVAQLVEGEFQGLICMRSANVAKHDRTKYAQAGAHCTFGKDVLMKQMVQEMKAAYVRCIVNSTSACSDCLTTAEDDADFPTLNPGEPSDLWVQPLDSAPRPTSPRQVAYQMQVLSP